ncbi:protein FAM124B [Pseudophryne corroboree]|uniref:protein FAM124B n=1 Tax=Pseudophryne corroboree TaxID=495146 RepID=UPI003081D6E3
MSSRHIVLPVTIHLLASSGHSVVFQQAINRLIHGLGLDTQLFLVSERAAPVQRYVERRRKREFPGISVTLFLREDLGEERISLLQSFFQLPPWDHINPEHNQGPSSSISQTCDDFYCLDAHMPVWGIRRVHYGAEILRVTLYCSYDNYEDAVRLYEMILRMEATSQMARFCSFVLQSTRHTSIQFSLKQLPPGVSVQVKDSCALQFIIQAIGQLVPLLPYPCMPISDTRWQTQDYDGNKILLLVVDSNTVAQGGDLFAPELRSNLCSAQLSSCTRPTKSTHSEEQIGLGNQKFKEFFKTTCETTDQRQNLHGTNDSDCLKLMPRHPDETEMNVDTGHRVMSLRRHMPPIYSLSRCLRSMSVYEHSHVSDPVYKDIQDLPSEQGDPNFPLTVKGNKEPDIRTKIFLPERSQRHHSNSKRLGEEFFI